MTEFSMVISQQWSTPWTSHSIPGYVPKGSELITQKYCLHSTTQHAVVSIQTQARCPDKEMIVCLHDGILLSRKTEWNHVFRNKMDTTGNYFPWWNKPIPKNTNNMPLLICDFISLQKYKKKCNVCEWNRFVRFWLLFQSLSVLWKTTIFLLAACWILYLVEG